MQLQAKTTQNLNKFTVRKVQVSSTQKSDAIADSVKAWIESYLHLAVVGVRSDAISQKIALHLRRFQAFFVDTYGHDRFSTCLRRDVQAWQNSLQTQGLAHSTINNHLASLSAFTTWVHGIDPLQRSGIGAQIRHCPTTLFTLFGSRSLIRRFHGCLQALQIQVGAVGRRSGLLPPRFGQGPDVERIKSEVIDNLCDLLLVLDPVSGKRKR
jgi:hypothetical protein